MKKTGTWSIIIMSRNTAICAYLKRKMVKRICSLLTLIVLVLTQCFSPMYYVLAENNAEQDFQVEEKMEQESETEEIREDKAEEIAQTEEETEEITKDKVEETAEIEDMDTTEDISIDNQKNEQEDETTEDLPTDNRSDNN